MTRLDFDPDLERLGEALRASTTIDLAREEQAHTLRSTTEPRSAAHRLRPRVLAGGTLGLAGVGAALVLALGGSTAPPAFADHEQQRWLGVGEAQLHHRPEPSPGEREARRDGDPRADQDRDGDRPGNNQRPGDLYAGAGRVEHVGAAGEGARGPNGTEVISQGESAGNTAEGTFHLASCGVYPANTGLSTLRGYSGNS